MRNISPIAGHPCSPMPIPFPLQLRRYAEARLRKEITEVNNLLVLVLLFPLVSAAQIQSLSCSSISITGAASDAWHGDAELACKQ